MNTITTSTPCYETGVYVPRRSYRLYVVTITGPYVAGEGSDSQHEFRAMNAADAIKQARRYLSDAGYTRHDGPFKFRARLADEQRG